MITEVKNGQCVEVRTAEEKDLPAALSLLGRADLPTAGVADAFSHFIVAESEGRLIGVVGLELYGGSALLRSAAVEESWRGSGVGRVLVDRALDLARQHRIEDVYLLTTTAEHYFPKFGFACVSRDAVTEGVRSSVEFQTACPASAVVMRKALRG
ncbi:MAG TPA: arsenic resistance N-acetyltransferase ArsN2 [Gemmatimonadales bacterium]|nr:arsenic resistance N-acetyltransferase ArsN2 [Gemmatimonadales bacterium]